MPGYFGLGRRSCGIKAWDGHLGKFRFWIVQRVDGLTEEEISRRVERIPKMCQLRLSRDCSSFRGLPIEQLRYVQLLALAAHQAKQFLCMMLQDL